MSFKSTPGAPLIAVFFAVLPLIGFAQGKVSFFDHLLTYDSVEVTIAASFKDLFKKNDTYIPAKLTVKVGTEVLMDTMGEIRSRGNSRKTICFMPPTKIRINKDYLKQRGWADYPTLKIVNACSFTELAESYVQVEHLIYKIYNTLTERSFRDKAVKLIYLDSDGKKKPSSFDGFLIEHEDQLAARMAGEVLNITYFKSEALDRQAYIIFTMFQYLIGNTDWKVLNKHNLEVVKVPGERAVYAVPYDFDYAGIINTTYAVPNDKLSIKSVRDRIYLGPCQTQEELKESRDLFITKKDAIASLLVKANLNERQRDGIHDFISKFYDVIEDEMMATRVFTNCIDY
ncbi:MAG: hypothetical protein IPL46_19395 [Saprospiraceae bacterium]|nr:hypothetical protein [Saprospiraceae bacterium]